MSSSFARTFVCATLLGACAPLLGAQNADQPSGQQAPRTWVDKDTGHRVWRLSDEKGSSGFYFNVNAYSPSGLGD
jgi:oligogalacturonide lyase